MFSESIALRHYGDDQFFTVRHLYAVAICVLLAVTLFCIWRGKFVTSYAYWFLAAAFILVLLTFLPAVGFSINGSNRWIRLFGFMIFPWPLVTQLFVFSVGYSE